MRIAIMGAGGIGGYFGGRLAEGGADVVFIARGEQLAAFRMDGLRIKSTLGDLHLPRVLATDDPRTLGRVDLVLIGVKLWDTEAAARAIAPLVSGETAVVSFQNGVEKDDMMRNVLGDAAVMGGVSYIAAAIAEPGVIAHNGTMQRLVFGEYDGRRSARAEAFLEACRRAKIDAELNTDIRRAIWEKFVFLVGLSGTTATMRAPIGPIRSNSQSRTFLLDVMREVVAVGRAKGVALDADYAESRLAFCDTLPETMTSSMAVDMERGNRLEIPWLSGAVVRTRRGRWSKCAAQSSDRGYSCASGRRMALMCAASPPLTLRSLSATPVAPPMARPLGTSVQTIHTAPLLLLDLETNEGITGRSYAFCYQASIACSLKRIVQDLDEALAGMPIEPFELGRRLARYFRLPGLAGPLAMVASAIDVAAWDALAIAAGLPLSGLLGSSPRPIAAYNSNGLGLIPPEAAADEADELLEEGFRAVKLRVGRPEMDADMAAVRAVRKRIPPDALLMVDFNQALTFAEAMMRCRALDDEGVYWIEEPIRHDDYRHSALIAEAVSTPIQAGENFVGLPPMAASLSAAASDYLMLDLDRIGGVSGWRSAVGLAAAYGREVSSHLFPEVSAHLLAATPTAHWLEFVDWAAPILEESLKAVGGKVSPLPGPGVGLRWNVEAVSKFRLDND